MKETCKMHASCMVVLLFFSGFTLAVFYIGSVEPTSPLHDLTQTVYTASASTAQNDSNWAGYVAASSLSSPQPNVTSVSASWHVPTILSATSSSASAVWIGVGGFYDSTLIQVGTEQDALTGRPMYSAWYEILPQSSVTISTITVSPGDDINASISLTNPTSNEWSIYITDITDNQTFQTTVTYASSKLTSDWIVERPVVDRQPAALANISSVTFTNCKATIGGTVGPINAFPNIQVTMYEAVMQTIGLQQLVSISSLNGGGSSFGAAPYGQPLPTPIPELTIWVTAALLAGTFFAVATKKAFKKLKKEKVAKTRLIGEPQVLVMLVT